MNDERTDLEDTGKAKELSPLGFESFLVLSNDCLSFPYRGVLALRSLRRDRICHLARPQYRPIERQGQPRNKICIAEEGAFVKSRQDPSGKSGRHVRKEQPYNEEGTFMDEEGASASHLLLIAFAPA